MVTFKNITDEEHKLELRKMIIDHYKELYGEEWIDSYIECLKAKKPNKFRDFVIKDLTKYSTKEDKVNKDMKLLFDNKEKNGENIAFGIINNNTIIGYMILTIHRQFKSNWELDKFGELYRIYIKPEYRESFLKSTKKEEFIASIKNYIEEFFKTHKVEDVLMTIPSELPDLISLGEDLGFIKENYVNEKTKDLWKKRI